MTLAITYYVDNTLTSNTKCITTTMNKKNAEKCKCHSQYVVHQMHRGNVSVCLLNNQGLAPAARKWLNPFYILTYYSLKSTFNHIRADVCLKTHFHLFRPYICTYIFYCSHRRQGNCHVCGENASQIFVSPDKKIYL